MGNAITLEAITGKLHPFDVAPELGTRGWKSLQRWNYAVFALAGGYALLYQEAIEKLRSWFVALVILCIAVTIALQMLVLFKRRRNQPDEAG